MNEDSSVSPARLSGRPPSPCYILLALIFRQNPLRQFPLAKNPVYIMAKRTLLLAFWPAALANRFPSCYIHLYLKLIWVGLHRAK